MKLRDTISNKWVRFSFWALLYVLWVVWLGSWWWLLGLAVVFDLTVTKKVNWTFWKPRDVRKRNTLTEWVDAIIFAVIVVTFINTFFIQAFKIPSSSMESTLMTGDHLFVSKLSYGPRMPQTPLTVPFTHNEMFGRQSYSTSVQCEYRRLKGLGNVRRYDSVVFGFPNGDTVLTRDPAADYYMYCRLFGREETINRLGPVKVRPMDKKDHYVKRCVAVPGDSLEIVDGVLIVNGQPAPVFEHQQSSYCVRTNGTKINSRIFGEMQLNEAEAWYSASLPGYPELNVTKGQIETISALPNVVSVEPNVYAFEDGKDSAEEIFPYRETDRWTRDNYGPIWIPSKGATVKLDAQSLPLYERIITAYEGHTLRSDGDSLLIDGIRTDSYTFAQDYYFMMGDNRHNSLDSRYWGFVPEDHIVGKPLVIWLSTDATRKFPYNIRWKRFLKFV